MTSRRISFIDIDQSYATAVADTAETGFMVVRAPKGTVEATYFPRGQATLIHSMIGIPTADWPDIQDAIDYNNNFGLWISAPSGSAAEYPSYYGGTYLTKKGLFPFYNMSSKEAEDLTYEVLVDVASENTFLGTDLSNTTVTWNSADPAPNIVLTVADNFTPYAKKLRFDYWGGAETENPAAVFEIFVDGINLKVMLDGVATTIGGVAEDGTWTIGNVETATDPLYLDPSTAPVGPTAIQERLQWIVDMSEETYLAIVQKSPTEKTTRTTISNIGYEKYYYDMQVGATVSAINNPTNVAQTGNAQGYYIYIDGNGDAILKRANYSTAPFPKGKYIKIGTVVNNDTAASMHIGKIYYANPVTNLLVLCDGTTQAFKLATDFNSVTFKVEEEVYPGRWISGGTFTGSLSESGVDTAGVKNYFKEILPDNANTFVEVVVRKTFDSDLDSTTMAYTGTKVVDSRAYGGAVSTVQYLVGQRYITKIIADKVATGVAGGTILDGDGVEAILLEGWAEAGSDKYETCGVFMDPSGNEAVQATQKSLRESVQKLSTFISTKKLTAAEKNDLSLVYVPARATGLALYTNEFTRRDSYSGKKYQSGLIGAMGSNLSRIMQDKYGGWAPMYTNIAGGLGGQLGVSVESAKYSFTNEELALLDATSINPLILSGTFGVMAEGQKTTQDPTNTSDWSYLGHSMAFDNFKREVRDNVMIPQIGKPNDTYFQELRRRQTEAILAKRITGLAPIWAAGKVEVENVNTADVKAARQFKIKVSVKVNVFSEWVVLEFVNVSQATTL